MTIMYQSDCGTKVIDLVQNLFRIRTEKITTCYRQEAHWSQCKERFNKKTERCKCQDKDNFQRTEDKNVNSLFIIFKT